MSVDDARSVHCGGEGGMMSSRHWSRLVTANVKVTGAPATDD